MQAGDMQGQQRMSRDQRQAMDMGDQTQERRRVERSGQSGQSGAQAGQQQRQPPSDRRMQSSQMREDTGTGVGRPGTSGYGADAYGGGN